MFATLLRPGVELRKLEPHHAGEFLANIDRSREHISPWVGRSFVAGDLDEARNILTRYADPQRALYGIWSGGTLIGGTMFVSLNPITRTCELGCWVEPGAQGQGLITQVVRMMLGYAFNERSMNRAEWRTSPSNVRSIAVAQRVGMTLDGILRQAFPGADGTMVDTAVYSLLAEDWRQTRPSNEDKAELDQLAHRFFAAFTNTDGVTAGLEVIRELFIPQGTIICNVRAKPVVYDLDTFIAPRQKMLSDGTLTDFREWETSESTQIAGTIAQRFSYYRKSGLLNGETYTGAGHKSTHFVRTGEGWRMSSMVWDDQF